MSNSDSDQSKLLLYWIKRCAAAEDFIAKSPCDPDITESQYTAYIEWVDRVNDPIPLTPEEQEHNKNVGWTTNLVKCDVCGFQWRAVYHIECRELECKVCGVNRNFERID